MANGSSTVKELVKSTDSLKQTIAMIQQNVPAAAGATTLAKILYIVSHPNVWAVIPSTLFFLCTVFVMYGKSYLPKACPPGTEVIIATALATIYSIQTNYSNDFGTVGEIPELDPNAGMSLGGIQLPIKIQSYEHLLFNVPITSRFNDSYLYLFITACIFSAINFLSVVGIASGFESENGVAWSPSRELVSQGVACGVAGMTGSAPVSGSLSRSLVSRMAGTTSQFGCMVTAMCWICFLPYMSIMTPTPKAALSAVIVSAVVKGVVVPKDLLKLNTFSDQLIGWGTALATACTSPTLGFGSGILLSTVVFIFQKVFGSKQKTL